MIARASAYRRRGPSALHATAERARADQPARFRGLPEAQSRVMLTTEAIIIGIPLTVLLVGRELPAQVIHLSHSPEPEALAIFASGLFMLAALLCLWRLVVLFAAQGSAALRRASAHVWALATLAAALALRMAAHYASAATLERSWLNEFAWGLPLMIPLLHVCLERWLRGPRQPVRREPRASRA